MVIAIKALRNIVIYNDLKLFYIKLS